MPTIILSPEEFSIQQGCDSYYDKKSNWYIYANGARSDNHRTHFPPPDDPTELLELKVVYPQLKYDKLKHAYLNAVASFERQAVWAAKGSSAGPPDETWAQELRLMGKAAAMRKVC